MFREVEHKTVPGFTALILLIALSLAGGYELRGAILAQSTPGMVGWGLGAALIVLGWAGLFMVNPN